MSNRISFVAGAAAKDRGKFSAAARPASETDNRQGGRLTNRFRCYMIKPSALATSVLIGVGALILACIAYSLIVSKGRTIFPIHVHFEPVRGPGTEIWVSALEQQLSPAQFEEVVKTNIVGRDYALGLFAHNDMTNHVRVLVKHGVDTSAEAMEALDLSGMSNAASLIRWVVTDLNKSSSNGVAVNVPSASPPQ